VLQSAVLDAFGRAWIGGPYWMWVGMQPGSVYPVQIGVIALGAIGSVAVASLVAEREVPSHPSGAAAPWAVVAMVLAAFGMWMLGQPMDMRAVGAFG